jgi:hypothetical protein
VTTGYEDVRAAMKVAVEVLDELDRAVAKFPGQHLASGTGEDVVWVPGKWATAREMANVLRARTDVASEDGTLTWRHVLLEELAEALAESDPAKLRAELVQVAAMCLRWILDLDDPDLPVYFTSPSGRLRREVARDVDGNATVQQYRCRYLSTAPNGWGCFDPRCGDSTWDHECPVAACTMASHLVLVEP